MNDGVRDEAADSDQGKGLSRGELLELRLGFYKFWTSVMLAVSSGALVMMYKVYSNEESNYFGFIGIGFLVVACIFTVGAAEAMVNRRYEKPSPSAGPIPKLLYKTCPKTLELEYITFGGAGLSAGLGLLFLGGFVLHAEGVFCGG